jgi:cytidine deaminase
MQDSELLKRAIQARRNSYAPYSHFAVGAALLTVGGRIYTGTNVENASYGLSLCAERVAIAKAVSEGEKSFVKIALVCPSDKDPCRPCGACLQVLREFAPEIIVIMGNLQGQMETRALPELLPHPFGR